MSQAIVAIVIFAIVIARLVVSSRMQSAQKKNAANDRPARPRAAESASVKTENVKKTARSARPNVQTNRKAVPRPNVQENKKTAPRPNVPSDRRTVPEPNVPQNRSYQRPSEEPAPAYSRQKHTSGKRTGSSARSDVKQQKTSKSAILDAAKVNTQEVELENDRDALVTDNLMDRVYDVMVKGPDDRIAFGRDFIAEATEMLNRYTIPGQQ